MPPALQTQMETITLEQYEALPEEKRAEVYDDIVYDMVSSSQIHQSISMQLSTIINNYILRKKGHCCIFNAPFDVKLSDFNRSALKYPFLHDCFFRCQNIALYPPRLLCKCHSVKS